MDDASALAALEKSTVRKVTLRLVPFVGLLFLINYLDRTAISFAGPNGLIDDLGLSVTQFGFASGVFLIGYIAVEVPSNLALHRFGARRWLSRIIVSWGLVSLLFTWVSNYEQLVALRFVLGVAEAGFFPGAVIFISLWVPIQHRSKVLALFYIAQPLSFVLGAPLAGAIMSQDAFGLEGWRLMFFCVSIPAIVLGVVCWFYLTDRPRDAKWLTQPQREWLERALTVETERTERRNDIPLRKVFFNGRVWLLIVVFFGLVYCIYALNFFLPLIISGFEEQFGTTFSVFQVGLITAVPYSFAVVALYFWSGDASRRGVRWWHVSVPVLVCAVSVSVAVFMNSPVATIAVISITAMGLFAALPVFWSLPTQFLTGAAAAAGVAFINTVANIGGFFAGYITGWLFDLTGSYVAPMFVVGVLLLIGAVVVFSIRGRLRTGREDLAEVALDARAASDA